MVAIKLTTEQHVRLHKLVVDKVKEVHAWTAALRSSLRAEELRELEFLLAAITKSTGEE